MIALLELPELTLDLERELLVVDSQSREEEAQINHADGQEYPYTGRA